MEPPPLQAGPRLAPPPFGPQPPWPPPPIRRPPPEYLKLWAPANRRIVVGTLAGGIAFDIAAHGRFATVAVSGLIFVVSGALLLSGAYILCLATCVAAFGSSVPIAKIGFVYLTGSALGSIIPTPGGLGAVEAALTAGLTAAGVPGAVAVSAVLLFRLLTFWLPVPLGWTAMNYLERRHDL